MSVTLHATFAHSGAATLAPPISSHPLQCMSNDKCIAYNVSNPPNIKTLINFASSPSVSLSAGLCWKLGEVRAAATSLLMLTDMPLSAGGAYISPETFLLEFHALATANQRAELSGLGSLPA